ncbi:MAG: hypothetical protein QHH07_07900 [Sedimentisphaerales bacterium]|nr:hypothetical protein [Sedimentisphaerales bacterium]
MGVASVIRLTCPSCNQRLKAPDKAGGKKVRCPRCGRLLQIPQQTKQSDAMEYAGPTGELRLRNPPPGEPLHKPQVPPWDLPPVEPPQAQGPITGRRACPWPIDILLYPANMPGLINGLVFWVFSLLTMAAWHLQLLPGYTWLVFMSLDLVLVIGLFYYLAAVIRDSASGRTRAPDNVTTWQGLAEVCKDGLSIAAIIALAALPAFVYVMWTDRFDSVFWVLAGIGGWNLPMLIMAVVLLDLPSALNPGYWLAAMIWTLPVYTALVLFLAAGMGLVSVLVLAALRHGLFLLVPPLVYYILVILAHILGRFYFRFDKRIGWDV